MEPSTSRVVAWSIRCGRGGASDFTTVTLAYNVKIHHVTRRAHDWGLNGSGEGEECGLLGALTERNTIFCKITNIFEDFQNRELESECVLFCLYAKYSC